MLHSLVTDAAWEGEHIPSSVRLMTHWVPKSAGAIQRRTVHGVSPRRIRASSLSNVAGFAMRLLNEERRFACIDEVVGLQCRARGLKGVRVIVNYHGNGGSFLDYAKSRGVSIATDFIITPKNIEIEQAERQRWPGWEEQTTSAAVIAFYRRRMSWLVGLSDIYLCPSATVARDLAGLPGFDPARVRLVPYGAGGITVLAPQTQPGRVLFAGAAGLRKGLPYLAAAATLLKQRRAPVEIVIAGAAPQRIRQRPETQVLTFLGVLDRIRMAQELARADLFCLPSLAEGSASSVYEAMANGLPTVTTSSSGSVVTDGVDGLIVPERDGRALADAIERIVADRTLRQTMSAAARATTARYSDEACGRRFIEVITALIASRRPDEV